MFYLKINFSLVCCIIVTWFYTIFKIFSIYWLLYFVWVNLFGLTLSWAFPIRIKAYAYKHTQKRHSTYFYSIFIEIVYKWTELNTSNQLTYLDSIFILYIRNHRYRDRVWMQMYSLARFELPSKGQLIYEIHIHSRTLKTLHIHFATIWFYKALAIFLNFRLCLFITTLILKR